MKDYNEITKNLIERRDEYIADKKLKTKKMRKIIIPVCCVGFVAILALGVWKGNYLKANLKSPPDEQAQVENSDYSEVNGHDVTNNEETDSKPNNNTNGDKTTNKNPNKNNGDVIVSEDSEGTVKDYLDKPNSNNNKDNNMHIVPNQDTTKEPKYIGRIEVTQKPIKTVYYVGDKLDFTGLEVTGYFLNGDVEDVTADCSFYTVGYACSPSKKYRIEVEYYDNTDLINGAWTEFAVTVIEPDLDVSKKNITLDVGESALNSVITQGIGCKVSWYSTDTSVVTVDNSGNITGVGNGTASVYAVITFGYHQYGYYTESFKKESPYCTVTVNEPETQAVSE